MHEHLLNIREAAEYLGVGERRVKELADSGRIPAYKIGGAFLRFKESQLAILKGDLNQGAGKRAGQEGLPEPVYSKLDDLKDFFYFNDFYILSIIVVSIAVILMVAA